MVAALAAATAGVLFLMDSGGGMGGDAAVPASGAPSVEVPGAGGPESGPVPAPESGSVAPGADEEPESPPAAAGGFAPKECLDLAAAAISDGRLPEALRALEHGLTATPADDVAIRARIFERLADVNAKLGRDAAAALFRDNARRLAREAAGPEILLELAREARLAGDFREERRRLHRFLLAEGGPAAQRPASVGEALAGIADSLIEEWKSLLPGRDLEALSDPPLDFEERR